MKKNVLLAGSFTKARSLAGSLTQKGYHVTIINAFPRECEILAEIRGANVILGDGTKPYILEDADAGNMDIAIALTPRDSDNLVICQLCKKMFHIPKTVSIVNDPKKTEFFYKMGIDSVVCTTNIITGLIEQQAFMDEMATIIPIGEGNLGLAEVPIPITSPAVGRELSRLELPRDVIIGCILRNEQNLIPRGDTRILAGDVVVLISAKKQELAAIKKLTGR